MEANIPRKKSAKRAIRPYEQFFFEIKSWEPTYLLATNRDEDDDAHFIEYAEIHLETACVEPEKYIGRSVRFLLSSRRNYLTPPRVPGVPSDKPTSVGLLHIRKDGGGFYGGVPHESISIMMTGLAANHFKYAMLMGPPLSYGESWCTDFHLMKSPD